MTTAVPAAVRWRRCPSWSCGRACLSRLWLRACASWAASSGLRMARASTMTRPSRWSRCAFALLQPLAHAVREHRAGRRRCAQADAALRAAHTVLARQCAMAPVPGLDMDRAAARGGDAAATRAF